MKKIIILLMVLIVIVVAIILFSKTTEIRVEKDISWAITSFRIWYMDNDYHLCRIDTNGKNNSCIEDKIKDRFVWSPNGKFIAFVAWNIDENNSSLYTINTEDLSKRGLVLNSKNIANNIEWSPDNRYIAYTLDDADSNKDGKIDYLDNKSIYLVDLRENKIIPLAKGTIDPFNPFYWFKDGKNIYFEREKTYSPNDVREQYVKINIKNKKEKLIAEVDAMKDPRILNYIDNDLLYFSNANSSFTLGRSDVSSNGKTVASEGGSISVNGEELIHFSGYDMKFNSGFSNPQWLPDNKYIIFEGPSRNVSFPLSILLSSHRCIFIADSVTKKVGKLADGWNAGFYKNSQ